ncbi:MAG: peptidylprolyl isomerase [Ruminococcus sp.]|nr:peptidylprolyl isomerase [Ruminococcus sp.]
MAKQEKTAAELYREERKARLAKAAKKNQKKSINSAASKTAGKAIAILLVIALLGGICGFAVNQSGVIQKGKVAFTIGDVEVTQPEYSFYYINMYNQIASNAQYMAAYGMSSSFDSSVAPESQTYGNDFGEIEDFPEDKTPTWADYIDFAVKHQLQQFKALVAEAEKLEITLDDEAKKTVQDAIDNYAESAASAAGEGSKFSLSAYLRYCFGKGVSKSLLTKILEEQQLAQMVQNKKTEELKASYTDKQIEKQYKDNINNYAVVTLRSYAFEAEKVKSGEGDDATEATTKETMAAAKKLANEFSTKATNEDSFKALASEAAKNDKEYITDDSKTLMKDATYNTIASAAGSDEKFADWAFSSKTEKNSTYVVENAETGYTVYMMVNPIHKAADTVTCDARHILIKFPEAEAAKTDDKASDKDAATEEGKETTEAETTAPAKEEIKVEPLDTSKYKDVTIDMGVTADTAKNKEAFKKAQDVLEEYLNGDKTADAFAELAHKYSEDTGSNEKGGLYETIESQNFVQPFKDWCLKDGRKQGDVGIIEYDDPDNYSGYHIMYMDKTEPVTWKDAVLDDLANADLSEYIEELSHGDNVKIDNVSEPVAQAVSDTLNSLIKRMNQNNSQSASH